MKKLYIMLLIIVTIVQLAVPIHKIRSLETVLRKGTLYRFQTRPIDPADPFQGRYVQLALKNKYFSTDQASAQSFRKKNQMIYVSVEVDANGFAYFSDGAREMPTAVDYLKTRTNGLHNRSEGSKKRGVKINIPFDRFYMEEGKAPRAEVLAADAARTSNCWVNVRIYKGNAVIEDVYAEGISLRELASEKDQKMTLP